MLGFSRRLELATYIPNDECVVVLAAKGSEELFIVGERQALDEDLVELEPLDGL